MPMYPLYDVCNIKHNTDKNSIINLPEKNKMNFKYINIILKLDVSPVFKNNKISVS